MVLSVSKDTYELLGIPGRPSAFGSLGQNFGSFVSCLSLQSAGESDVSVFLFLVIEIPLNVPSARGGEKAFERIRTSLRNWPCGTNLFAEISGIPSRTLTGKTFEMVMSYVDSEGTCLYISIPNNVQLIPTLGNQVNRRR